ncbi:TetR/AcrR family transcriptional regulator [Mobilicoccus pelagius]|uniref:Putative TetR family transcriptional regulator n=1 Tax=Mobilicoccus pelagius NBRC 104925 TaxID=1089455 RepID=H5UPS2_9MICO|nr:TetR family transcriptional regulator [Mobilicoccus pelagius]GAB47727.1 putative TetR family transcriptional regulator [Mobilicoccus pelagius NBRC 104925]
MTDQVRARSRRRHDPERRDRIIAAALRVIAERGVTGTSMRRVADEADVPLGSMTYHFAGVEELLLESFTRFTDSSVADFDAAFESVSTLQEAREALVRILTDSPYMRADNIVIGAELYSAAAHDPTFRPVHLAWMHRCRRTIRAYFDEPTTLMLDAMIEGLSVHRTFEQHVHPDEMVRELIARLTPPGSFVSARANA